MPHLEWFFIDTLASLIVGFIPGILLGTHLSRSFFAQIMRSEELHLPRPRTQALIHSRLPRLTGRRDPKEEDELYYE